MDQGQNTKQRLLTAARSLFAERGYHSATVRDIALRARTNLASINYYFHSKDDLYREVMRGAVQDSVSSLQDEEKSVGLAEGSPQDQLRAFITQLIAPSSRGSKEDTEQRRLMAWEMLSPTGAVEPMDEWGIGPHLDTARKVIEPFLSDDANDEDSLTTAIWLIGQCLVFRKLAQSQALEAGGTSCDDDTVSISLQAENQNRVELVLARAMSGLCA